MVPFPTDIRFGSESQREIGRVQRTHLFRIWRYALLVCREKCTIHISSETPKLRRSATEFCCEINASQRNRRRVLIPQIPNGSDVWNVRWAKAGIVVDSTPRRRH